MASALTDRQWLLFLSVLPDVGRKTLRHVLERQQVRRETPAEILSLPDEVLRDEYRLPPRALRALREERAARLEEVARLDAHLTRCGVRWLSFQDAAYPTALEAMPEPPAMLFLYGNHALLDGLTVALLGSHTISAEGLQELERLAESLMAQGLTPIVSATQPAYQCALLCAVRTSAPYILALDRGLLRAFGDDLRKEPLKQARIWQAEFDPARALADQPVPPPRRLARLKRQVPRRADRLPRRRSDCRRGAPRRLHRATVPRTAPARAHGLCDGPSDQTPCQGNRPDT